MEQKLFLIGIVLTLVIVLAMVYKKQYEGFEPIELKLLDRTNPLAAQQNPLTNPAAQIGIPEGEANMLRYTSVFALNSPNEIPTGTGSFQQKMPENIISPLINNENSFLGLVKFCKDTGKNKNPFSDPNFAENCGMCLTSGSLITGESFNTPTGVVVYGKDKEKAYKNMMDNKQLFPRTIPSLKAAICKGASVSDDSLPVLALNEKDYIEFQKRQECIDKQTVGNDCGICEGTNKYSWVDPNGGMSPFTLILYGNGTATVRIGGRTVGQQLQLSETQGTQVNIGRALEGTQIQVENVKGSSQNDPYIYGALISTNPNGKPYRIALEKIIEKDAITGSTPRRGTMKLFVEIRMNLMKLLPKPNETRMVLEGQIPLTFVESDQLAAFDCPSSPFMTKPESADLLLSNPCTRPKGQEPGKYSTECLQETVLEGGCSTNGNYYKNPKTYAGDMSKGEFKKWIEEKASLAETNIDIARDCLGKDISTPCDKFLNDPNAVPDKECMVYLYKNTGSTNKRLGAAYSDGFTNFRSLTNQIGEVSNQQFCQKAGTLNPETAKGLSELRMKAMNYKNKKGLEAVKQYLSDTFSKATGNLDINLKDDEGGKRDSWEKCFGIKLADPVITLSSVAKNSRGQVQDPVPTVPCSSALPRNWNPKRNTLLARNFFQTGNYVMSFKIRPKTRPSNWANIIRIGLDGKRDCCDFGLRSPAIWLHPDMWLHVRIGSSNDGNWGLNTQAIPLNQDTSFRLSCQGNQVVLTVNDKTFTATQPGVRPTGNMEVWGSDSIYQAANCDITDFCLQIF